LYLFYLVFLTGMSCESHFQYLAETSLNESCVNASMSQQPPKSNIIHRRFTKDKEEKRKEYDEDEDEDEDKDEDNDNDDGDTLLNACVVINNMFHFCTINGVICIETCIDKLSEWCGHK